MIIIIAFMSTPLTWDFKFKLDGNKGEKLKE